MKTQIEPPANESWMNKANLKRVAAWTVVFLGLIWAMAPLLNRPVVEPIMNSWVLTGRGLASFPMWGYSLLMRVLGSLGMVVALQSFLGALATAALMVRLQGLAPRVRTLTTLFFLTAGPWLSYIAYAYQMPIGSALMVLSLLLLEEAIRGGSAWFGPGAGALFGSGQNFRSELVLLPGAILATVLALRQLRRTEIKLRPILTCVGVALFLQIPWALNCYLNEGRFSLTESNLGHAAFVGLGCLPSNPWKIEPSDAFAEDTVAQAGFNCDSLSFRGGDFLKRKCIELVRQNPGAYAKCVAYRIWFPICHPFHYVGLKLTPDEERAFRKLFQTIKFRTGSGAPSVAHPQPAGGSVSKIRVGVALMYATLQGGIARVVLILGIAGIILAVRGNGVFSARQPLILCLAIACAYRFGLNVAVCPGGKYMTGVYLCYLPFAINGAERFFGLLGRWRKPVRVPAESGSGPVRRPGHDQFAG